MVEPDRQMTV